MAQQTLPNEDKSVVLTEIVAKNCVLSLLTHLSPHMPRGPIKSDSTLNLYSPKFNILKFSYNGMWM